MESLSKFEKIVVSCLVAIVAINSLVALLSFILVFLFA